MGEARVVFGICLQLDLAAGALEAMYTTHDE